MASRADLLAEVEITDRYELTADESFDEVLTMEMADAVVTTPIFNAQPEQEVVIYVSLVSRDPDGTFAWAIGANAGRTLMPGARVITALDEETPGQHELTGGQLLIGSHETLTALRTDDCWTPELRSLGSEIAGRTAPDVIAELVAGVKDRDLPDPPTTPTPSVTTAG